MTRLARPSSLDRLTWWFATGFGSGLVPRAPGTAGSLVGLGLAILVARWLPWPGQALLWGGLAVVGVDLTGRTARALGLRDPSAVVWDEVVGMGLAGLAAGHQWLVWAASFALFRALDIAKPGPVGWCERLPGGFGIMADDVLAGLLTTALVALGRVRGWA